MHQPFVTDKVIVMVAKVVYFTEKCGVAKPGNLPLLFGGLY